MRMLEEGIFAAWEENIVCTETGNRRVQYYMKKHSSGDLVLAVRGYERSLRHMVYVVSDDFLHDYGSLTSIKSGTKWRSKREVIHWLNSLVSTSSKSKAVKGSQGVSQGGSGYLRIYQKHQTIQVPRRFKIKHSQVEWSGDSWVCYKQLKHYSTFIVNGVTIAAHSFVFIISEEGVVYVAYLDDLYEDKNLLKRAKVRLFLSGKEANIVNGNPNEIIMTPHVQVISAGCICDTAIVLTPSHYEKCLSSCENGIHICFRQLNNNTLEPFYVSKMRGYTNQSILSYSETSKHKRKRSHVYYGDQMVSSEKTCKKLRIKIKSKRTVGAGCEEVCFPKVNEKIEVLCQDSGIRGCWFRCKVLQISKKNLLRVQHMDVLNVEGSKNLQEWVRASRVADPDKLGMRISGRLTIRPCPHEDSSELESFSIKVGDAVDAWWSDGWWEGVVTGQTDDTFHVHLLGEGRWLTFERKLLRKSRDWVDKRWVDVEPNTDVVHSLESSLKIKAVKEDATVEPEDLKIMLNLKKRLRLNFENEVRSGFFSF